MRARQRRLPGLALALALVLALASPLAGQDILPAGLPGARTFGAQEVLAALAEAYPGRFSPAHRVGADWGTELDGQTYLWAEGRLLPAAQGSPGKAGPSAWAPQPFYPYPLDLPPFRLPSPEERTRIEALLAQRDSKPPAREASFLDRLWGASTEAQAWARQKRVRFLGKELLLHRDLLEELALVEADIVALAGRDPQVAAWADNLGEVSSYYWRDIAGTQSRSYHSYGAAIDLVPRKTGGRAWYWLDARGSGLDWLALPYGARSMVPAAVVKAFESRGFIWGGKWLFWDTVHFEYRPEILVLNGQKPGVQASLR